MVTDLEALRKITAFENVMHQVEEEEAEEAGEEEQTEDPNKDKFTPHFVHWDKANMLTLSEQLRLFEYVGEQLND